MNLKSYNLDSLRKLVRDLQKENKELRSLLSEANIPHAKSEYSQKQLRLPQAMILTKGQESIIST